MFKMRRLAADKIWKAPNPLWWLVFPERRGGKDSFGRWELRRVERRGQNGEHFSQICLAVIPVVALIFRKEKDKKKMNNCFHFHKRSWILQICLDKVRKTTQEPTQPKHNAAKSGSYRANQKGDIYRSTDNSRWQDDDTSTLTLGCLPLLDDETRQVVTSAAPAPAFDGDHPHSRQVKPPVTLTGQLHF